MNIRLLGVAAALALLPTAALAGAATLSADYANLDVYGAGFSANSYGVSGAGVVNFRGAWKLEGDGSYHRTSTAGLDANNYDFSASAFWQGDRGRAGLQVGYDSGQGVGPSIHALNYGLVGEWWASSNITLSLKGGGLTGSSGVNGYYGGLQGKGYLFQNFVLSAAIDYDRYSGGHETDYTVGAEWLVSQTTPVSIFASYTNTDFEGGGSDIDTWLIGIRLYCNDPPGTALVDRQRSGTLGWAGSINPTALRF